MLRTSGTPHWNRLHESFCNRARTSVVPQTSHKTWGFSPRGVFHNRTSYGSNQFHGPDPWHMLFPDRRPSSLHLTAGRYRRSSPTRCHPDRAQRRGIRGCSWSSGGVGDNPLDEAINGRIGRCMKALDDRSRADYSYCSGPQEPLPLYRDIHRVPATLVSPWIP